MKTIVEILRGVLIGLANIIPGVSGGTMMVSMGIYDTIIGCINTLFKDFKRCVKILWPYLVGMVLGILGLAKLITYLLGTFPLQTNLTFIGLIFGGLPVILKKTKDEKKGAPGLIAFLAAFALVIVLQILGEGNGQDAALSFSIGQILILFIMGVIASATMVIPGVSGSMMLMLLGYYNPVVGSVSRMVDALLHVNMGEILACCGVLVPFGIGVVVGIFAIAKLIEMLLSRYPGPTYCAILGLVAASPVAILMAMDYAGVTLISWVIGVVLFAAGFAAAYRLGGE
ncbi:MAG: DUF368 domain-containing protein [Clostridiales bacterium]|nr:DUF368 domain-containing protein [Clostridiales bacterium]